VRRRNGRTGERANGPAAGRAYGTDGEDKGRHGVFASVENQQQGRAEAPVEDVYRLVKARLADGEQKEQKEKREWKDDYKKNARARYEAYSNAMPRTEEGTAHRWLRTPTLTISSSARCCASGDEAW